MTTGIAEQVGVLVVVIILIGLYLTPGVATVHSTVRGNLGRRQAFGFITFFYGGSQVIYGSPFLGIWSLVIGLLSVIVGIALLVSGEQ